MVPVQKHTAMKFLTLDLEKFQTISSILSSLSSGGGSLHARSRKFHERDQRNVPGYEPFETDLPLFEF